MEVIKGEKVVLKAMCIDDLKYFKNNFRVELLKDLKPGAKPETTDNNNWVIRHQKDPNIYEFTVVTKKNSNIIGHARISDINWISRNCKVDLVILDKKNRNKGFGKDTVIALCNYAFFFLNLKRIESYIFSYNKRSINLFESLNFKKEGNLRKSVSWGGQFFDTYIYGLLRNEFRKKYDIFKNF